MKKLVTTEQSEFFKAQVPHEVVMEVARIVGLSYADSAAFAESRWGRIEAKDALSIVRRADIETALTTLGAKFKRHGVIVRKVPNRNVTDWHTEIRCGAVVMTQSKTEGPDVAIREAIYRATLATDCRVNMPWAQPTTVTADDADTLWACVVHGPSDNPAVPAYVRIVFPLTDGTFQDYISITALAAATAGAAKPEQITEVMARLRRVAKRAEVAE